MSKKIKIIAACVLGIVVIIVVFFLSKPSGTSDVNNNKNEEVSGVSSENDTDSVKEPAFNTEPDEGGKIAFYDFDKKVISTQDRKSGDPIIIPENVEIPYGYTFVGWDKPIESIKSSERINADFVYIGDKNNAFYIDSKSGKKGETISLPVYLGGKVELCGCEMSLLYDKDKLNFVKFDSIDDDVMVNKVEDGVIKFNLVSNENIMGDVKLFDAEFKIVDDSDYSTELVFDSGKVVKLINEGKEIVATDIYVSNGKVYIVK